MFSSDEDSGDIAPQPVQATFPVSIRSSRRRRSRLSGPPTPPSACEESAHYPVFNPEDPRHNPTLRANEWPDDANGLSQTAHPTGSRHWMQSLPGRSLRRARSGLQALRSGLHRRSVHQTSDGEVVTNGVLWPSSDSAEASSDQHERRFSSTVSEASTEEDYDFGTHLYRTGCNYPGLSDDIDDMHPSPLTSLPTSSTEAGRPLTNGLYPTPEDSPGEDLSPVTPDSDNPSPTDAHHGVQDEQTAVNPATTSSSTPPDEEFESPVESLSSIGSLISGISDAAIPLDETMADPSAGDGLQTSESIVPVEETDVTSVFCVTSPTASENPHTTQTPDDESAIEEEAGELAAKDTSVPESPHTDNIADDTGSLHEEETVLECQLNNVAVPEVALGDIGDLNYFLTLNRLDDSDLSGSKSSDEDPSPNSLSEDDANGPISPWIPLDKGDRTSLLSLRDEYFLVDGKSTDLRPDRGNNPIKRERAFSGDGGLHSGPGLDRALSLRTQEIPEIIGPGGPMGLPSPLPLRGDREGSDSTEEYLVTYSLLHRHYFS
ncbi:hypothetical protein BJX62DRAFT_137918 [Aspergillus germanicus]